METRSRHINRTDRPFFRVKWPETPTVGRDRVGRLLLLPPAHAPVSEADGHEAIRQQFAAIFASMPDIRFETVRLEVRPGLFTQEWYVTTTLAQPFAVGDRVAQPTGEPIRFRGVDVISCEEGLVRRKDCYLDGVGLEVALFGTA